MTGVHAICQKLTGNTCFNFSKRIFVDFSHDFLLAKSFLSKVSKMKITEDQKSHPESDNYN